MGFANSRRIHIPNKRDIPKPIDGSQRYPGLRCIIHDYLRSRDIIRSLNSILSRPDSYLRYLSLWSNNHNNGHGITHLPIQNLPEVSTPTEVHRTILTQLRTSTSPRTQHSLCTPNIPPHRANDSIRLWNSQLHVPNLRRNAHIPFPRTPRLHLHTPSHLLTPRLRPHILRLLPPLPPTPPPIPLLKVRSPDNCFPWPASRRCWTARLRTLR